jgi:ligand-binding sensor domain-containing protein/signal transduction histidine kinase
VSHCRLRFWLRRAAFRFGRLTCPLLPLIFGGIPPDAYGTSNYFTHLWQSEDGLPQNAVTSIAQTRDGYLWVGTYGGLARFDGIRFTRFDPSNYPQLKSSRVTSLFEDREGSLWIGHETGEVVRFKQGRFEEMAEPSGWQGKKIVAICEDELGDFWLVSDDGLMSRLRDGLLLVPPTGSALGLVSVANDPAGHIWMARHGALSKLQGGKLAPITLDDFGAEPYVQGICPGRDGALWVSVNGRIRKWNVNHWSQDLGEAPWGLRGVTGMIETREGCLAVGTIDSGLDIINCRGGVLHFNHTNSLPQNWVRALCEDHEGNLWVAAGSGGLVALRAGKVAAIGPPEGWQGRAVLSVTAARDNSLWISTEGAGIYHFSNERWEHFGENDGLSNQFVWSLGEDSQGTLWAATWGGGMFVKQGNRFVRPPGLEENTVPMTTLLHGQNGITWIGTAAGLLRYEAGKVSSFGEREGLELADVRAVTQARDGTVWFAMTGGGLGRLRDGSLKQFRKRDGLSSDFLQALRIDTDGILWIGTSSGGLNRMRGEHFAAITRTNGLADDVICDIEEDDRGYFWMSSHNGIMRVSKAELNACADGRTNWVDCLTYGKGEGLPTLECSGGMQPAGCKTLDGRLWFPTSRGLVAIDPSDVKKNQLPPPVVIEELLVDGRPLLPSQRSHSRLQITPGRHRFEFHFTGLSFTVPEKVRFKHRLDGLEQEWSDADSMRSADYSYIAPGEYTFRVMACNNDGVWNESEASLRFKVLPHFWQTWWFRVLSVICGVIVVAAAAVFTMRRRLERKLERLEHQRALERERARIAKDIHDDLGASLTRISMLSQSARSEPDPTLAASDLDRIYDTSRELTRAMDEIVWAVNPQHDSLDSLATYLGKFAQDFLAAAHIKCRLDVPMQLPSWPLTAEIRHNLFLAFKEAINNSVKHAHTSEVRISLAINGMGFTLQVEDKGCGFTLDSAGNGSPRDPARISSGYGLGNMRRRLEEIGGHCELHSAPGTGTRVAFIVPVKIAMP